MTDLAGVAYESAAAYRLTRLVVADTITGPVRAWVFLRWPPPGWLCDKGEKPPGPEAVPSRLRRLLGPRSYPWEYGLWKRQPGGQVSFTPVEEITELPEEPDMRWFAPKGTKLGTLARCWWCSGVWCSAVVVVASGPRRLRHPVRLVVRVLAVSAGAAAIVDRLEANTHTELHG